MWLVSIYCKFLVIINNRRSKRLHILTIFSSWIFNNKCNLCEKIFHTFIFVQKSIFIFFFVIDEKLALRIAGSSLGHINIRMDRHLRSDTFSYVHSFCGCTAKVEHDDNRWNAISRGLTSESLLSLRACNIFQIVGVRAPN